MKPEIFIGLGTPKSQLFFDIQAMIAKNGGRLKLADIIDAESVRAPTRKKLHQKRAFYNRFEVWTKKEDAFIVANLPPKEISLLTGRSLKSVYNRRWRLNKIPSFKNNYPDKFVNQ